MRRVRINVGGVTATAALLDNDTADGIWQALPISSRGNRWGGEIYFETAVRLPQATDAKDVLEPGELGYWPMGAAFCIFWGPTPASHGAEVRAYSPVNVFGRLEGDPLVFDGIPDGTDVRIDQLPAGD